MDKRPTPTNAWIAERAKRADVKRALAILQRASTEAPVQAGDEVPGTTRG
jgi:hypothetical protein